jgi:hypothetical protein
VDSLPLSEETLIVRTDFADPVAWDKLRSVINDPYQPVSALFVDDPRFAGLSPEQLLVRLPQGYDGAIIAVADTTTFASAELPVVIVYVDDDDNPEDPSDPDHVPPPRSNQFRCVAAAYSEVEVNLSLANVDFEDFLDAASADGIYRTL